MNREWRPAEPRLIASTGRRSYPTTLETAALRSRLVSRLTGLSTSKLQYWHETFLQVAHRRGGARGVPRLYSWIDYQRLCVVASLQTQHVPTERIRVAVHYLDDVFPEWYRLSLLPWEGELPVPGVRGRTHIALKEEIFHVLADAAGQMTYRETLGEGWQSEVSDALTTALEEIARRGVLFRLDQFSDSVEMNPDVNVGLPTLKGTRLETGFLSSLVHLSSVGEVASLYCLNPALVERAVAFQQEAA